jgi:hypothetical protein
MTSPTVVDELGNVLVRWDYETRTFFDYRVDPPTSRPFTAEENASADADAAEALADTNLADLIAKGRAALDRNATFLAITSPTTAQAVTQVKALTRQVNALIKITARDLTDTAGT